MRHFDSNLLIESSRRVVRQSLTVFAVWRVVHIWLQASILYLVILPALSEHLGQYRVYNSISPNVAGPYKQRRLFCSGWPSTVCLETSHDETSTPPRPFPLPVNWSFRPSSFLTFFLKQRAETCFSTIFLSALIRSAPTSKRPRPFVQTIAFENWIILFGVPSFLLADDGSQAFTKLLKKLCTGCKVKLYVTLRTTRIQLVNLIAVACFSSLYFVIIFQNIEKSCDMFGQPIAYVYNMQGYWTTNNSRLSNALQGNQQRYR